MQHLWISSYHPRHFIIFTFVNIISFTGSNVQSLQFSDLAVIFDACNVLIKGVIMDSEQKCSYVQRLKQRGLAGLKRRQDGKQAFIKLVACKIIAFCV